MPSETSTLDLEAPNCVNCGEHVRVVDRFQDYSTTRGPMAEHVLTKCDSCGQQHLLHLAAQTRSAHR